MDAFAEVELAVVVILRICGEKVGSEPFSAKISKLKSATPSSRLSKVAVGKLPGLVTRCSDVANLRNDIVHSKLKIAIIDDEHKACFINLRDDDKSSQTARLMSLQGIRDIASDMVDLAEALRSLISPPSSQPPPSQDAAGDP